MAGLYTFRSGSDPIKLIEVSIAGADARAVTELPESVRPAPKAGYWFRALRFADESSPDPRRFAACAYPASPSSGKAMYLVSHEGVVYSKAEGWERGLEIWPADPLNDGWKRLE